MRDIWFGGNVKKSALAGVCTVLIACGGDAGLRVASVRDSAGLRIVSNPAWPGAENSLVKLSDEPALVIGNNGNGPAEERFAFISGVLRLSDGGIAVANAGSFEVRIFDSSGKFVRALGRGGNGPGEFQSLYGIYLLPRDSIAAFDTQQQAMTVFAADGTLGRTFTITGSPMGSRVTPAGILNAGERDATWLMLFAPNISTLAPGAARVPLFLARFDQGGALRDTVLTVPGFELFVHDNGKAGGRVSPTVLFGRGSAVAVTGHGFLAASNDAFAVNRYNDDGKLETIIRQATTPRTVTAADVAEAREAQLLQFRGPEQKALLREAHLHMPESRTMPAFGSLLPGRFPWIVVNKGGGFWMLNFQSPSEKRAVWSIFDREGKMHGRISLPEFFTLHEVGSDYILGVHKDSLDVERVMLYGLSTK